MEDIKNMCTTDRDSELKLGEHIAKLWMNETRLLIGNQHQTMHDSPTGCRIPRPPQPTLTLIRGVKLYRSRGRAVDDGSTTFKWCDAHRI